MTGVYSVSDILITAAKVALDADIFAVPTPDMACCVISIA
jgi:hypothetical protein